ncbi:hypothetical protein [Aciditerrimonas ferrireducens]|uniref:hypothetical protein n=1 Tax=Aciditerrimonas ferrireducens TaxID=667306 RepID=UPI002004E210|nr:hypothetical protein [Aciditerrimonas ferrireducens]MCK4177061.1 hypothetical protein [Aciditerrimonas ferrireducens]
MDEEGTRASAWRLVVPVLVALGMLLVAQAVPAVLFPEGAALASGIVVLGQADWAASPGRLATVVPVAALGGVGLARSGLAPWQAELVGLVGVLALLRLAGSRLAPALSAGLIPSVFHVTAFAYAASVAVICGLLATGLVVGRGRLGPPAAPSRTGGPPRRGFSLLASGLVAVVAGALIVIAGVARGAPAGLVAPPLFVSLLELVAGAGTGWVGSSWQRRGTMLAVRWASLVAAAGLGALVVGELGHDWAVVVPLVALEALVVAVLWGRGLRHPPPAALVLVPLLAGHLAAGRFAVGVALGAAWVCVVGALARVGLEALRRRGAPTRGSLDG